MKSGIQYALRYIENVLKWIPWPAILVALALLSYVVGRWRMLIFTSVAVLFFGFMGLWENTIDTVALMVVSVSIAVATGLPLGVIAARNQLADNIMRPDTGRDANDAQLRCICCRVYCFRAGVTGGHICNADICHTARD